MEAAKLVMNSEASSLMLMDELTGDLNVSIPTGPVKDEIIGMAVPKSKGIGGWVISYNKPFISNDVVESDVFWKDLSTGFTTRNIICVPLQDSEGNAFGVLQAINKKDGKKFKNEDVPVFEALALHVSSAIERSRKFDELERKLGEREAQLEETNHLYKENLEAVSAFLEFDLKEIENQDIRYLLSAANSRIKSIESAYSVPTDQINANKVNLSEFLSQVAQNVEGIYENDEREAFLNFRFEEVFLDFKRCMYCGLILHELLIRAYNSTLANVDLAEIILSLKQTSKEKIVLIVTDNGHPSKSKAKNTHADLTIPVMESLKYSC